MSSESRRPVEVDREPSKGGSSGAGESPTGRGNLVVVSAPSGAGKSSLVERALKSVDRLLYSISYTTRQVRGAEKDGVDYFFVSHEEFLAMREKGEFLESAEVHGYLYGTRRYWLELRLAEGYDVILDIDVQGAEQIRARMPEAITVFVLPPSREVLESRLRLRNLNEPADLERRMKNATAEVQLYDRFKYVIVNDSLERASSALEGIILTERHRSERQSNVARKIIATFGSEAK
ncbi:MAG TPA: guanylate kinase [Blastocatellia bacterium]|jgi:guanylate kinase|nr:guanylate kinase [Blastocatellia bacterium]